MGFNFGNAIAAVSDPNIRACLERLGRESHSAGSTLSTLVRNNTSTSELIAGAGLTGGGPFNSSTSTTMDVGAGFGITVNADSVAVNTAVIPSGSGSNPNIAVWTAANSLGAGVAVDDGTSFSVSAASGSGGTLGGAQLSVPSGDLGGPSPLQANDAITHANNGQDMSIRAGNASGNSNAGNLNLQGGASGTSGPAGSANLIGGAGGSTTGLPAGAYVTGGTGRGSGINGEDAYLSGGPAIGGGGAVNGLVSVLDPTARKRARLRATSLTADRIFDFPDSAGTLALTSGFPVGADPTGSVGLSAVNGSAATFLRSDGAPALSQSISPTWTGTHTFNTNRDVHNAGVSLGTSGRLDSSVADAASAVSFLVQPSVSLTSGTDRYWVNFKDSSGNSLLNALSNGAWNFNGAGGGSGYITVGSTIAFSLGIDFSPTINNSTGVTINGKANSIAGANFQAVATANSAPTGYVVGGAFGAQESNYSSGNVPTGFIGALFCGLSVAFNNSGKTFTDLNGWRSVKLPTGVKNAGTFTNVCGGYVEDHVAPPTGVTYTNQYGLYVEESTRGGTIKNGIFLANATAGYKAIAIRDQNAWIGSAAAGEITLGGTSTRITSTNHGFFSATAIAQPTTAIAAATFVSNTSAILNDSATWDGYTVGQVVKALRNLGLLA